MGNSRRFGAIGRQELVFAALCAVILFTGLVILALGAGGAWLARYSRQPRSVECEAVSGSADETSHRRSSAGSDETSQREPTGSDQKEPLTISSLKELENAAPRTEIAITGVFYGETGDWGFDNRAIASGVEEQTKPEEVLIMEG